MSEFDIDEGEFLEWCEHPCTVKMLALWKRRGEEATRALATGTSMTLDWLRLLQGRCVEIQSILGVKELLKPRKKDDRDTPS